MNLHNRLYTTKKNAELAQKIEIALLRLSKELHAIQSISAASDKTITYKRQGTTGMETHTVSWTMEGKAINIDGYPLIDNVKSFSLKYFDKFDAPPSAYSNKTLLIEFTVYSADSATRFRRNPPPSSDPSRQGVPIDSATPGRSAATLVF